ncbi:hypothetical protein [Aestuariivirga sp.]|uniref:hypothetical protein n=1 Tax=Aestuariivirga sp. TaxID=2650926 RepID=UPI003BAD7562
MTWSSDKIIFPILESSLLELADDAFQRRVWLGYSKTEMSSMTEATAGLFDDSNLDWALEKQQVVFSPDIDNELRKLGKKLSRSLTLEEKVGLEAVLDSAEWKEIQNTAGRILSEINKLR